MVGPDRGLSPLAIAVDVGFSLVAAVERTIPFVVEIASLLAEDNGSLDFCATLFVPVLPFVDVTDRALPGRLGCCGGSCNNSKCLTRVNASKTSV